MALYTAYPTVQDFDRLLRAAGLRNAVQGEDALAMLAQSFPEYLDSAVSQWEADTNFRPFLAMGETTRYYTPQGSESRHHGMGGWGTLLGTGVSGGGRVLELDGGLVGLSSLSTGGIWNEDGTFTPGVTRVLNVDFTLEPHNAPALKRPYEWIQFQTPIYGSVNSLALTGWFGFCPNAPTNFFPEGAVGLPANAFRAVLNLALLAAQSEIEAQVGQGLLGWTEAGVSEKYRDDPFERVFGSAQTLVNKALATYTREELGF